jgi:hypothetical protein
MEAKKEREMNQRFLLSRLNDHPSSLLFRQQPENQNKPHSQAIAMPEILHILVVGPLARNV